MKRDMELIRKILYAIEEKVGNTAITDSDLNIDNYSMDEVGYHCAIMYEGGLISHFNGHYYDGQLNFFSVGRLTWNGHELLDQIRNDTVWNKTKTAITSKGLPFAIDIIKEVASAVLSSMTIAAISTINSK